MYKLRLTDEELDALEYIADRYDYASVLRDALEEDDSDPNLFRIPESDAWEIAEVVEAEDGYLPLMGGSLRDKVERFLEGIV